MSVRKRQILIVLLTLLTVFAADQITKTLIMTSIPHGSVSWMDKDETFFWLTHERNEGLVGGAFRQTPAFALSLSLGATLVLIYLFRHLHADSRVQSLAYGLVAGGAAGNMFDRLVHGSVTDFLQFNFYFIPFDFPWKQYPAFNIADACICTGVVVLILTWHYAEKSLASNAAHSL